MWCPCLFALEEIRVASPTRRSIALDQLDAYLAAGWCCTGAVPRSQRKPGEEEVVVGWRGSGRPVEPRTAKQGRR